MARRIVHARRVRRSFDAEERKKWQARVEADLPLSMTRSLSGESRRHRVALSDGRREWQRTRGFSRQPDASVICSGHRHLIPESCGRSQRAGLWHYGDRCWADGQRKSGSQREWWRADGQRVDPGLRMRARMKGECGGGEQAEMKQ